MYIIRGTNVIKPVFTFCLHQNIKSDKLDLLNESMPIAYTQTQG